MPWGLLHARGSLSRYTWDQQLYVVSEPRETHSPMLKARFLHLTIMVAAESNPRPFDYQANVLPLSHGSPLMVTLYIQCYTLSTWLLSIYMVTLYLHGYPLSTWLPSIYMVTLYIHGYPLSTWLPSIYMVTLYLHGYPLSTWLPSVYMVTLCLHDYPLSTWLPSIYMVTLYLHIIVVFCPRYDISIFNIYNVYTLCSFHIVLFYLYYVIFSYFVNMPCQ